MLYGNNRFYMLEKNNSIILFESIIKNIVILEYFINNCREKKYINVWT